MTTYNTLALDRTAWDLIVDGAGNIGMVSPALRIGARCGKRDQIVFGRIVVFGREGYPLFRANLRQTRAAYGTCCTD